jgi:hypothetical protein
MEKVSSSYSSLATQPSQLGKEPNSLTGLGVSATEYHSTQSPTVSQDYEKIGRERTKALVASLAETKDEWMKALWPGISSWYGEHYSTFKEEYGMTTTGSKLTPDEIKYIQESEDGADKLSQKERDEHITTLTDRVISMMSEIRKLNALEGCP